jgi:hypothetical protein
VRVRHCFTRGPFSWRSPLNQVCFHWAKFPLQCTVPHFTQRQTDGHSLEEQHTQMRPEAIIWLKPCTAKIAGQGHMSFSCACQGSEMNQYQFETNRSPSEISLGKGPRMSALKCTYSTDGHTLRGPRSALQLTATLIINWARLSRSTIQNSGTGAR